MPHFLQPLVRFPVARKKTPNSTFAMIANFDTRAHGLMLFFVHGAERRRQGFARANGCAAAVCLAAMLAPISIVWGQVQESWVARYNGHGSENDLMAAMVADDAANVYVTGGSLSDYVTVKYSPSGSQLWVANYSSPGNNNDSAKAIAVDSAGNVYVTGMARSSRYYEETYCDDYGRCQTYKVFLPDYATLKYDSGGRQKWAARFECYSALDTPRAIAVDSSGNVIVTGTSGTVYYDATGNPIWSDRSAPGITLASDGVSNLYVCTGYDYAPGDLVKYAANGTRLWTAQKKGGPGLALDAAGHVYVTGYTVGTRKLDASGNELWSSEVGGSALRLDSAGNAYVISGSFLTKFSPQGQSLWQALYSGPGSPGTATAGAVDGGGNVYLTGYFPSTNATLILMTSRYDPQGNLLWAISRSQPV